MPDIASVLKEEMRRLARSEVKKEIAPLKKRIQALRKTIAQQREHTAKLEKKISQAAGRAAKTPDVAAPIAGEQVSSARITVASIRAQRKRLRLSQREMGLLLDVSSMAISRWELGQAKPRGKNRDAFIVLRGMGRPQAKERLEELEK